MNRRAGLNHIYRLVWSRVSNAWVAVSEITKGPGKTSNRSKLAAVLLAMPALGAINAQAGLEGGQVVGGQGTIVTPDYVEQYTPRLAITADGFNVGAGATFTLKQNYATDLAYIKVTGQNPSDILGRINARGQLFLSNPNGILFGRNAQVNVGGLVATTLGLSPEDFMAGKTTFGAGGHAGGILNQGELTAVDGGYIALLAPEVRNEGIISAHLGTALMAAGDQVTLTLDNGSLLGYRIDQGTLAALVDNKHLIQADGGQVLMGARAADTLATAVINNSGVIRARTVENRNGRILLMGDMQSGTVNVDGTLDASAPESLNPNGGHGGFVETSAAHVKVADTAKVTTLATQGSNIASVMTYKNGTWLIDPNDFTISATGDINGAAVSSALAFGNVAIQTASMGTAGGNGDIFVNEAVSWNTNNTFTLNAERNININADITATNATGKLNLFYGQASATGGPSDNYFIAAGNTINLQAGDNFSTQKGSAGPVINYTVITDLGQEGSTNGADLQGMNSNSLTKNFVLGADIDASETATWTQGFDPIGSATNGVDTVQFDGLGHTIDSLNIWKPLTRTGFFDMARGTIQNVRFTNASVTANQTTNTGSMYAGILAGTIEGATVRNVWTSGTVRVGDSYTGWHLGGLAGGLYGTLLQSGSGAQVTNLSNSVGATGGLLGASGGAFSEAGAVILDSFATGDVSGGRNVGGLIGMSGDPITHGWATGHVTGTDNVGGLVGYFSGQIRESYAQNPAVTGENYVGGLVGYMYHASGSIVDSYANSVVSGSDSVGGLIGANGDGTIGMVPANVTRSYAAGLVTGNTKVGGLIGEHYSAVNLPTDSYWNTQTTGQVTGIGAGGAGAGVTGKTTAEMQTLSAFTGAGWDIDAAGSTGKVWRMYEGQTAPLLRYFLAPVTLTPANVSKTYNGLPYGGGNGLTMSATTAPGNLQGVIAYGGNSQGAIDVGNYTITGLGRYAQQNNGYDALVQNYDISYAPGTLTITPAPLTISAHNASKTYDGIGYAGGNGVSFSGLVNGETSAVLGGGLHYGGSSQGAVNAGRYGISPGGYTSSNYNISFADGTLNIVGDAGYRTVASVSPSVSICVNNGLMGSEGFVRATDGSLELSDAAPYEIDANGAAIDKAQLQLGSNCLCELPRTGEHIKIRLMDGGIRLADTALVPFAIEENYTLRTLPRTIRARRAL